MVIGAIEIDGAHRPAQGCRAVPMEMHKYWGGRGSAVFWLLRRAGAPKGPTPRPRERAAMGWPLEVLTFSVSV